MLILVVEDDHSIRETLGFILELEGHQAVLTEDGEKAIHYLSSCDAHSWPEAMMLDLTLPGMSGDEVFFEIGRRFKKVPRTVLMTGATHGSEKVKYLNGSFFLAKPFTLDQLSETIRQIREPHPLPIANATG